MKLWWEYNEVKSCGQSVGEMYSPRSADFTKSPWPLDFSWVRTATLRCGQLNSPLIWSILKPGCCRGGPRGETRRTATRLGDKISVILVWQPIFFYLTTNNATKWQINQTTVHTNVYFTVDAIMHMYILCKQLDGSVILDIQCTQEWSGDDNM